jgi:hypothetical protein
MEKIKLNFRLAPNYHDRAPKMLVTLNEQVLFDEELVETKEFESELDVEDDSTYKLRFNLHGKQDEDTVVDDNGNIVKDQTVTVSNIKFDDIELDSMLSLDMDNFYYSHDGVRDPFYDTMGRNGNSVITFTTPLYTWLLENL